MHGRHRVLARLASDPTLAGGDLPAAFAAIAREGVAALDVDRVSVWLFDADQAALHCRCIEDRAAAGAPLPASLPREQHPAYLGHLDEARALVAGDAQSDPRLAELRQAYLLPHGVHALVDAPIRQRGRVAGVVCAEHLQPRAWQPDDVDLLASLADFASLALATAASLAAEAALRDQRAQLDLILGHADAVIFTIDQRGQFEYMSPGVRHFAAAEPADVIGNDWRSIAHEGDHAAIRHAAASLLGGATDRAQVDFRVPDGDEPGRWRTLSAVITLMVAADGHRRVVGSAIDVSTARAAAERADALTAQLEQARRHQALGRLAGGIAHEFNNLLTVLLGGTDLLQLQAEAAGRDTALVRSMREATQRASRFTRQLLAFSGRQLLDLQRLDVAHVVEALVPLLRASIPSSVSLVVRHDAALPAVMADRHALEQVLLELVLRAVQGMPAGGEVLLVLAAVANPAPRALRGGTLAAGDFVCIHVADTGTRLTELQLKQAFEPFADLQLREDPQALEGQLRLAAAFGSVQQHRGVVDARIAAGDGGTDAAATPFANDFLIHLPVHVEIPAARPQPNATVNVPQPTPGSSARILVVEDEPDVLRLATLILQGAGYDTEAAQTVDDALRRVEQEQAHFDLLVTDVVMPGLDGVRLYQRLRRVAPQLRVLYMSGYAPDDLPLTMAPDAITSYLQKPFSLAQLRDKVRDVLHA
jgi:PAS domain S-box-containing protein